MPEKLSDIMSRGMGIFERRKPTGDFIPGFNPETDFLIVKIGNEQYCVVKPNDLVPLIVDVSMMSAIPPFNAYISYYKYGRAVYTNAQYVLRIDTKNIDPKIFRKLKYHKEIIKEEAEYLAKRKELDKLNERRWGEKKYYFVEHITNKYFLYFNVYVTLSLAELMALPDKLKGYTPAEYYKDYGKEKFENDIKSRTIAHNRCEYYFTVADGGPNFGGYNTKNEGIFLTPIKVYCRLDIDECRYKFDAKAMELLYGKPIDFFKDKEQANEAYIFEWFEYTNN
ncbi:MAG: hypothetical protein EOP00_35010 [Pedobacter sp.]|nr:MAG: hypothetical protein EOP00_35010 [Pedobacter sp.]